MVAQLKPRRFKKPTLPSNYQWAHTLGEFSPIDVPSSIYSNIAKMLIQQDGLVENIRRQYNGGRFIVGLAIGSRMIVLEALSTKVLYQQPEQPVTPNPLRFVYFHCGLDGVRLLSTEDTVRVRSASPDIFTHRLLREAEVKSIELALNVNAMRKEA